MATTIWPKSFRRIDHVKPFLVTLSLVISLIVAGIFIFLYSRTNDLLLQRVREQAIAYADLINHTKMWNFDYGGVYVEKRPGVETNAYLKKLGIVPDVQSTEGRTFTIRNHAIMVEEISRRSERQDGVRFRLVSTAPLNAVNRADQFETKGIESFKNGVQERYEMSLGSPASYRYLLPLYADRTCLQCHRDQGYREGSVMGATSITIPIATVVRESDKNRLVTILAAMVTIGLLLLVVYLLTWRLVMRLDEAQKTLKVMATTDALTGLKNRHHIMKRLAEEFERSCRMGTPLCLVAIDIDHFKRINDNYGHPFGDRVLTSVAGWMRQGLRRYDILGRVGGEEFLIISPGSSMTEAFTLAERLRKSIGETPVMDGDHSVQFTISAGVAILQPCDDCLESLLKRVDAALYEAKNSGRNRVVAADNNEPTS